MYTIFVLDQESDDFMRLELDRQTILTMFRFQFEAFRGVEDDKKYAAPGRYANDLFSFLVDTHNYVNQPKCNSCYTPLTPAERQADGLCPICRENNPPLEHRITNFMTSNRLAYQNAEGKLNLDLMAQDAAAEFGLSGYPESFRRLAEKIET